MPLALRSAGLRKTTAAEIGSETIKTYCLKNSEMLFIVLKCAWARYWYSARRNSSNCVLTLGAENDEAPLDTLATQGNAGVHRRKIEHHKPICHQLLKLEESNVTY